MIEADPSSLGKSVSIMLDIQIVRLPTLNHYWQWHAKVDQYERTCVSGTITSSTSSIDGGGDMSMEFAFLLGAPAMMAQLALLMQGTAVNQCYR